MTSPIRPKPVLFKTLVASQPAIAPMTSVTIKPSIVIAVSPRKPPANRRQNADHARRPNYGFFGLAQVVRHPVLAQARSRYGIPEPRKLHCTKRVAAQHYIVH